MASKIPKFSELPLDKDGPHYNAWGLYGKDDELGFLNRLTDDVVVNAAKEIKTGARFSLNLPLKMKIALFGRQPFEHDIYHKTGRIVNDDVWKLNSQSSTQWDGLRHFGYQKEGKFYNGVTLDDIHGPNKSDRNGIGAWSEKGIVGRGVLIDYHKWRLANGISHDPFASQAIPLSHLKSALESQGTEVQFGDILFVRSGYTNLYNQKTAEEITELMSGRQRPELAGVEQSEEMLKWIWESFSAVAGDHPSFERWPVEPDCQHWLHEVLLAGWGCPIGELFDLEKLAEHCQSENRWSFFVTSEPCNVPGGVASPPNIIAIF